MSARTHHLILSATTMLVALAATGLFRPAFADGISIYGTMHYAWEYIDTNDASGDAADDVAGANHVSLLGFEGHEDLGNGYRAFFTIESDINNTVGSNNTFVGIEGDFGTLLLGRTNTPYKSSIEDWNVWADTSGDAHAILSADAAGNNNFDTLAPQALLYMSPEVAGLQFALARIAVKDNDVPGAADDIGWSTSLRYVNGPLSAALAYEKHEGDSLGLGSTDTVSEQAWRLGAQYHLGDSTIAAVYEDIRHGDPTVRQSRAAWWLCFSHAVGSDIFTVTYAKAGNSDVAGGNDGARQLTVGIQHDLSERTRVYVLHSIIDNDANAAYGLAGGGYAASAAGRDVSAVSFGIVHTF